MTKEVILQPIKRQGYAVPSFWIDEVHLTFDLDPQKTRVLNRMHIRPNKDVKHPQALRLDGEGVDLSRVLINGEGCPFRIEETPRGTQLVIEKVPQGPFELEVFTTCKPGHNTEYQGLYVSEGAFFTQCEAESFRRITYFLDRPDVMAVYTVTLRADQKLYPTLLSNGNLQEEGALGDGRHFATWHDPFRKPSYLFALVAGQFSCREQRIKTTSGGNHLLQVYVRAGDLNKTEHALNSLIKSIKWDENCYGLKLDLERFMIVAVGDFNMGAMENKGLNIFNTKYVLANANTATDDDYLGVESVIAHEYFHNWTGNRVTCRDWFQLTLKEGLTVFRDQEFSMDMAGTLSGRAIRRINDVRTLRAHQFPEDAGPMAHPIRPEEYVEVDNFYTATIYEKGAEVIRMVQTMVGRAGFRKGLDLYFQRFDGQAVTCDDFIQAMADANPDTPLTVYHKEFMRWYDQAGTPHIKADGAYDKENKTYTLTLSQHSPKHPKNKPFVIPVIMGLLNGKTGQELELYFAGEEPQGALTRVLYLTDKKKTWVFENVTEQPIPSLFRAFSAPVHLETSLGDEECLTILKHDIDPFNRWEAGQRLALSRILEFVNKGESVKLDPAFIDAFKQVVYDSSIDSGLKALILTLPSESYIAEQLKEIDAQHIHVVRESMLNQLAQTLRTDWVATYTVNNNRRNDEISYKAAGYRALSNLALAYICRVTGEDDSQKWEGKAYQRFKDARNMTQRLGSLQALQAAGSKLLPTALAQFLKDFKQDALVVDKWFQIQAMASDMGGDVLPRVRELLKHPQFTYKNPNRLRSLVSAYCQGNISAFHRKDGQGYEFWAEQVLELNKVNPQIGARLARALEHWGRLAEPYQEHALRALQKVAAHQNLRPEIKEVVCRALGTLKEDDSVVKTPAAKTVKVTKTAKTTKAVKVTKVTETTKTKAKKTSSPVAAKKAVVAKVATKPAAKKTTAAKKTSAIKLAAKKVAAKKTTAIKPAAKKISAKKSAKKVAVADEKNNEKS